MSAASGNGRSAAAALNEAGIFVKGTMGPLMRGRATDIATGLVNEDEDEEPCE